MLQHISASSGLFTEYTASSLMWQVELRCAVSERDKEQSLLLDPGVTVVEHTEPTRFDSNSFCSHSFLLQHLVQSCLLYGSWGDFLLVGQKLKFPI